MFVPVWVIAERHCQDAGLYPRHGLLQTGPATPDRGDKLIVADIQQIREVLRVVANLIVMIEKPGKLLRALWGVVSFGIQALPIEAHCW